MVEYQFHKLCLLFPQADQKTIDDIAADIKENGQNDPIILFEGQILDGRNRYLACQQIGVEPSFKQYAGDEPLQFVVSKNLHRRHLNESQRAMLANKIWRMLSGESNSNKSSPKVTQEDVREQLKVSTGSVRTAARVDELAIDDIKEKVSSGVMSLNKAANVVKKARKATGISEKAKNLTPIEKEQLKKAQTDIIAEEMGEPRNLNAQEFNEQVLSGVYDGKRYRRDVQEIQTIIAKIETLPTLFDDAISMIGTLEQEKMLLTALDMLGTAINNAEEKFQLHPTSYDEVMSVVSELMNERFKLPDPPESDERSFVEELKNQYLIDCATLRDDISKLKKRIKNSASKSEE